MENEKSNLVKFPLPQPSAEDVIRRHIENMRSTFGDTTLTHVLKSVLAQGKRRRKVKAG